MTRTSNARLLWLVLAALLVLPLAPIAHADEAVTKAAPAEAKKAPPRKALLWVVDSKPRIYLFGTIHVGDPRVLDHPPVVEKALAESGVLFTEINMEKMNPQAMLPLLTLPGNETLQEILSPELWARTDKVLTKAGTPLALFNKMKPFVIFFRLQLAGMKPEQMENPALDAQLFTGSKESGKIVDGLETVDEQLSIFDDMSYDEQAKLISSTLDALDMADKAGGDAPIQGLIDLYLEGDIDKLQKAVLSQADNGDPFTRRLMKAILDDRNVRMADRMVARLKDNPDKAHFVAVGAAHYPGEMGILTLLRKKGLRVWRATEPAHLLADPSAKKKEKKATGTNRSRSRRAPGRTMRRVRIGPFCIPVRCCPKR